MKALYLLAGVLFAIWSQAQSNSRQNTTYTPIESIITDLNSDSVNDTIILYQTPVEGDPGLFTKMNVSANGRRMTFHAKDAWDIVSSDLAKAGKNAIGSKLAYVHKESGQSYIFLFGYPYAAGREEVFILRVKGRNMEIVFHNELAELRSITDLDNDGHAELIVRTDPEIYDATTKGEIGAYSPYIVFDLSSFTIDKTLTEKYNREKYIWEGTEYNGDIKVLYPKDGGKPKLLKTK